MPSYGEPFELRYVGGESSAVQPRVGLQRCGEATCAGLLAGGRWHDARPTVLGRAEPGARGRVNGGDLCGGGSSIETRKARWWRRTTACAHDTSRCDQTMAVLHTAIEAVSGRPPRSATHFTAQLRGIVPISSSLVWADSKLGIPQRLAYTQGRAAASSHGGSLLVATLFQLERQRS